MTFHLNRKENESCQDHCYAHLIGIIKYSGWQHENEKGQLMQLHHMSYVIAVV